MKEAIGIDPDSTGFVCCLVEAGSGKPLTRRFSVTQESLELFLQWVKEEGCPIVAIEGTHGQSRPIEKALREAGVVFHSFKPADTNTFRKAVLGQNKNNQRDAESVARYALALEGQGKLEQYRRVWCADMELQLLTRRYASITAQLTAEVNSLWKLLRYACPDLYLVLGGLNAEGEKRGKVLKNLGILSLLSSQPDIGTWKTLSVEDMLQAMGGGDYKGRRQIIEKLLEVAGRFPSLSARMAFLLTSSARQIERTKREQTQLVQVLEATTGNHAAVQALKAWRGVGTISAATMIAEIIDIRRFASDDSLACYCGLGMREYSTGGTTMMIPHRQYNRRLKDAFMMAAWNVILFDRDSHVAGYYRNLVKAGMKPLEACKRVARSLVRRLFRDLSCIVRQPPDEQVVEEGESGMASDASRGEQGHQSNMPPSTLVSTETNTREKIKARHPRRAKARSSRRGRAGAKKSA
jgi:transposase